MPRLVPLAALQHYAFCPRQCALIHNEQIWEENYLTALGQQMHQRVDSGEPENRKDIRMERGVAVSAPQLGLVGKLDLLEIDLITNEYKPVEYKRGKPKPHASDQVQLCAQALCLEEMLDISITTGALWYGQIRHRIDIELNKELRQLTLTVIRKVQDVLESGQTPRAMYSSSCRSCSLYDWCQPKISEHDGSRNYAKNLFQVETSNA